MTALKVATDFRLVADFGKDSEVDLFRKLATSLVKNSRSIFVDETHGASKSNVSFSLTNGVSTRCEIADLLVVVRSKDFSYLRATFWQAKKESRSRWVAFGSVDSHVDFTGQFNQWDLLSRRPTISGVAPFHPPADLLSSFDSASIGSIGIFYERASKIEVMHSAAEFVACGSPSAKHPKFVANGFFEKYSYMHGEALVRPTLEAFLQALFGHQVGAILVPGASAHQWIADYARSKLLVNGTRPPDAFFSGYGAQRVFVDGAAGDGMSLLLVDVDAA